MISLYLKRSKEELKKWRTPESSLDQVKMTEFAKIVYTTFLDDSLDFEMKNTGDDGVIRFIVNKAGTDDLIAKGSYDAPKGYSKEYSFNISEPSVDIFVTTNKGVTTDKVLGLKNTQLDEDEEKKAPEDMDHVIIEDYEVPSEVSYGKKFDIKARMFNPTDEQKTAGFGCSLRNSKGFIIDLPVQTAVAKSDNHRKIIWPYAISSDDTFDIIFKLWEEEKPPLKNEIYSTGWIENAIKVIDVPEDKKAPTPEFQAQQYKDFVAMMRRFAGFKDIEKEEPSVALALNALESAKTKEEAIKAAGDYVKALSRVKL